MNGIELEGYSRNLPFYITEPLTFIKAPTLQGWIPCGSQFSVKTLSPAFTVLSGGFAHREFVCVKKEFHVLFTH